MFIDETVVEVKAGDGGNGCFSHERGRGRPYGKPNGGDGGDGGDVVVAGSVHAHTLLDLSYRKRYTAQRGQHGKGSTKKGKRGDDTVIPIPVGTIVMDDATSEILFDCKKPDQRYTVASGGRGGRGNASLVNKNNIDPDHAEYGEPGEDKRLRLVLKLIADVGLVGRPNAGKSTFLSTISAAHPAIADYPFTTKQPHLGIVKLLDPGDTFVAADIPGLIEGSHTGKGMGIQFLKHIERTRVLAIMVDATYPDPLSEAQMLLNELKEYSIRLAQKPKCFLLTKIDLLSEPPATIPEGWIGISSVTGQGINEAVMRIKELLRTASQEE